jgi:transposase
VKWDLADLASPADIAEECGVGKSTVSNWIARYPDFPRPLATVAQGKTPLFSRKAVIAWYDQKDWKHDGPRSSRQHAGTQFT